MSRPGLLRVIADRIDGSARLPDAIDGLKRPNIPTLTFHGAVDVSPWVARFNCDKPTLKRRKLSGQEYVVATYRGSYLGTTVDIKVYST